MFGINLWRSVARTLLISGLLVCCLNLWGCGGSSHAVPKGRSASQPSAKAAPVKLAGKISEVSPPEVIQELRAVLEKYQPQVTIVSPRLNEVLQEDTVSVRLQIKDFPLFKDEKLELGPHLHLFLDNQPYQAVYDVSQPIVLKDLAPGTHTLRAFASRPWHESFKNEGSFAQTTFHIFTKTPDNNPSPDQPLLTYSRPQGVYGAEPIMLDFFLTNAPLHLVAQEDDQDDVADWRIKVTVNGSEFVLDRWQPLYLKGFNLGKNWVQLEYIDEQGNPIQNVYNNVARSFTYTPNGKDTLSKLVRDELSFSQVRSIVDPNYKAETPEPSPEPVPTPIVPLPAPAPVVKPSPEVKESPIVEPTPKIEPSEPLKSEEPKPVEEPKGGFFNRFRRPAETAKPSPSATPEPIPSASPEPTPSVAPAPTEPIEEPAPKLEEDKPAEIKETPKKGFFDRFRRTESPKPAPVVIPEPTLSVPPEIVPIEKPAPEIPETKVPEVPVPQKTEAPKSRFYDRFRRPAQTPKPSPSIAPAPLDNIEEPTPKPAETKPSESPNPELKTELERRLGIPLTSPGKSTSEVKPAESKQSEPSEVLEVKPVEPKPQPIQPRQPNQFRRPTSSPIESPKG
ncbi:MAG: hypothetical protein DCF14_10750 [Phormidesmis priestleyi]|nr:MAG: hypothetical protein DCF14_10750 [Phormidesmis priestleyi]